MGLDHEGFRREIRDQDMGAAGEGLVLAGLLQWESLSSPSKVRAALAHVPDPAQEARRSDPVADRAEEQRLKQQRARLEEAHARAVRHWKVKAEAKDWDSVVADLEVYTYPGTVIIEDPRRTQEYRVVCELQLDAVRDGRSQAGGQGIFPSLAATEMSKERTVKSEELDRSRLSLADIAVLREECWRKPAACWVEDTSCTTLRQLRHDIIPAGDPVRTPSPNLGCEEADQAYSQRRGRKMRFCEERRIYADDVTVRTGRVLDSRVYADADQRPAEELLRGLGLVPKGPSKERGASYGEKSSTGLTVSSGASSRSPFAHQCRGFRRRSALQVRLCLLLHILFHLVLFQAAPSVVVWVRASAAFTCERVATTEVMPYNRVNEQYYLIGHPGTIKRRDGSRADVAYDRAEYNWMEKVSKGRVGRFPWDALVSVAATNMLRHGRGTGAGRVKLAEDGSLSLTLIVRDPYVALLLRGIDPWDRIRQVWDGIQRSNEYAEKCRVQLFVDSHGDPRARVTQGHSLRIWNDICPESAGLKRIGPTSDSTSQGLDMENQHAWQRSKKNLGTMKTLKYSKW